MAQLSEKQSDSFQPSWVDKAASAAAFGAGGMLGSVVGVPKMLKEIDGYADRRKVVVYTREALEEGGSLATEAARTLQEQELAIADGHVAHEGAPRDSQELLVALAKEGGLYIFLPALLGAIAVEALSASIRWKRHRRRQTPKTANAPQAVATEVIDLSDVPIAVRPPLSEKYR